MTRDLLNTLFVGSENALVRLEGDTLRVETEGNAPRKVPLIHIAAVYLFGTAHITAPAMERCAAEGRSIVFFHRGGRFRYRLSGPICGNVLLRQAQYEAQRDPVVAAHTARAFVAGKIQNQRATLLRGARDSKNEASRARLDAAGNALAVLLASLPAQTTLDSIRGIEGQAAAMYFDVFGSLLTVPPADFAFLHRTRRPPRDRVNAVLSFLYALLTADCNAACEGVGLDPQFGFLHCLRPGRPALALDLMEEFRPVLADRVALTLINRRELRPEHFTERTDAGESVLMTDAGRKIVLEAYHHRKTQEGGSFAGKGEGADGTAVSSASAGTRAAFARRPRDLPAVPRLTFSLAFLMEGVFGWIF